MTRGAVLFAFNSSNYNYYDMALFTASRINHFLNLPVTLITDENSIGDKSNIFDSIIKIKPDVSNQRKNQIWVNKGRYQGFELSPYDETLILDVDYVINSQKLLKIFDFMDDFCCHDNTSFLMNLDSTQEFLSPISYKTMWATVIAFKKTKRVKHIFECLEMVQNNYDHYCNLHRFISAFYRNDYALTLATKIANGHLTPKQDIIPWNLLHIYGNDMKLYSNSKKEFNKEYTVIKTVQKNNKTKNEYITIKDLDFHMINKDNFLELI